LFNYLWPASCREREREREVVMQAMRLGWC
jgi:hypothetical protein